VLDAQVPNEYLVGHLEEALIKDERLAEQGLHVFVHSDPLIVTVRGVVADAVRKEAIGEVIRGVLPEAEVQDCTTTADYPEPDGVEVVP
jgi:hypothetical protein